VLITGWGGQIAQYVKKELGAYELYGVGSQYGNGFVFSRDLLEIALECIIPDIVIHLSGISNSEEAKDNPLKTLEINGLQCARICDIIQKRGWKTKLVNASSSEIYKGHINKCIEEDDNYYNNLHPYSIGKVLSHTTIQYYRKEYNLPFSNAILFMTESKLRNESFLLAKVKSHASGWSSSKNTVLTLGSLDSYRNINHAEDVASAIHIIINQDKGDDYLVCGKEHYQVLDIVKKIYEVYNIVLKGGCDDDILYDSCSGLPVIKINRRFRGLVTDIDGNSTKLANLGWRVKHTINTIIIDINKC
jgi:GDPmannose 4,6-dehydratase